MRALIGTDLFTVVPLVVLVQSIMVLSTEEELNNFFSMYK